MKSTDLISMENAQLVKPIGSEQVLEFLRILERYSAGRKKTADRILSAENWWKLRNTQEAQKETATGADGGFTSRSGWLHNVITSKHADAMDAFPHAAFLPREEGDEAEADMLEQIVPCILEQNDFEEVYSDAMWQKCKTGTGAYKITWDQSKANGLGDISITCVNLLNLYWQPEITDIQKSRYFFHTELIDPDLLKAQYPDIDIGSVTKTFVQSKFLSDESGDDSNKATVIEVYYHKNVNGKNTLQYCKFVGNVVLYATENETEPEIDELGNIVKLSMAETGLYDHGKYPYVFDVLFPVEGSPCGYGFVDLCRNPQIAIDSLKTSFVKNAKVGATPRYFSRGEGNIKETEFLDLNQPIVHVAGNMDDASLRPVNYNHLDGTYLNVLQDTVNELRETTGNTETAAGSGTPSGVTAAAAIAALQQASGKGSRDMSRGSYRAFIKLCTFILELDRQFYDLPRKFRIVGDNGRRKYVEYTNERLKPQSMPLVGDGLEAEQRLPVFDIEVQAEKKSPYSTLADNELAIQLFQMGFFRPEMAQQATMTIKLMDFAQKDEVLQMISQNNQTMDLLTHYMQFALDVATGKPVTPSLELAQSIIADMQQVLDIEAPAASSPAVSGMDAMTAEHPATARARQQTAEAPIPR